MKVKLIIATSVISFVLVILVSLAIIYFNWEYGKGKFNELLHGKLGIIESIYAYKSKNDGIHLQGDDLLKGLEIALKTATDITGKAESEKIFGDNCYVEIKYVGGGSTSHLVYIAEGDSAKLIITSPDGGSDFRYYIITVDKSVGEKMKQIIDSLMRKYVNGLNHK